MMSVAEKNIALYQKRRKKISTAHIILQYSYKERCEPKTKRRRSKLKKKKNDEKKHIKKSAKTDNSK